MVVNNSKDVSAELAHFPCKSVSGGVGVVVALA